MTRWHGLAISGWTRSSSRTNGRFCSGLPVISTTARQIDSTWRLESLVVLAWALGRFDIPPHDALVAVDPLWRSLGYLDVKAARTLLAKPSLRPWAEIGALRNRMFTVHWRLRNFRIHPGTIDFAEYARTCWFGPMDISGLPLVGGDLALRGKRIDYALQVEFDKAYSAAQNATKRPIGSGKDRSGFRRPAWRPSGLELHCRVDAIK